MLRPVTKQCYDDTCSRLRKEYLYGLIASGLHFEPEISSFRMSIDHLNGKRTAALYTATRSRSVKISTVEKFARLFFRFRRPQRPQVRLASPPSRHISVLDLVLALSLAATTCYRSTQQSDRMSNGG
jgi:hypothetical protein